MAAITIPINLESEYRNDVVRDNTIKITISGERVWNVSRELILSLLREEGIEVRKLISIWRKDKPFEWFVASQTMEITRALVLKQSVNKYGRVFAFSLASVRTVDVRILWLPVDVSNKFVTDVISRLAPVKVLSVKREMINVDDLVLDSGVRLVKVQGSEEAVAQLPPMVTMRDGHSFLLSVRGRPPMCLKCLQIGHVRRNCTVEPRRGPPTYARAAVGVPIVSVEDDYLEDEDDWSQRRRAFVERERDETSREEVDVRSSGLERGGGRGGAGSGRDDGRRGDDVRGEDGRRGDEGRGDGARGEDERRGDDARGGGGSDGRGNSACEGMINQLLIDAVEKAEAIRVVKMVKKQKEEAVRAVKEAKEQEVMLFGTDSEGDVEEETKVKKIVNSDEEMSSEEDENKDTMDKLMDLSMSESSSPDASPASVPRSPASEEGVFTPAAVDDGGSPNPHKRPRTDDAIIAAAGEAVPPDGAGMEI